MEDKNYLIEAFRAFDDLQEDIFDISTQDGLEDAKDYIEAPVEDTEEVIIDMDADTEEEVKEDYIDDVILQCEICKAMVYKKPEEVIINEETGLANKEEACPSCQSDEGFKVIGQVKEFTKEEPEEVKVEDEDNLTESKSLKEEIENITVETDKEKISMDSTTEGKVTVTTEPKEEIIAPVEDEVSAKFKTDDDNIEEVDFDEFEEKDFDELGESYLKNVYDNVKSFKTTKASLSGDKIKLEGLITFKSGKQGRTNFIFESYKATKTGKLKFIGENKQLAKGRKPFTLTGRAEGKKLVCESLTYNYKVKAEDGSLKRLYDTVKR